ncbi:MAG: nucleotidyltransferase family protein [Chloroflexi bacterium]|nr:nucleotidyltransferase family protein [Chloroflexota bacterium]
MSLTALVLAGGKGERLRPYTEHRPKPMVEVDGVPLLEYHLRWLKANGVTRVVALCGYRADVVQKHFGDGSKVGLQLDYLVEDEPLGRGGALRRGLLSILPEERRVVATNGDIITQQPLAPLLEFHRAHDSLASLMLTPYRSPYGIVEARPDGRISGFREKEVLPYWINAGVYVLSRLVVDYLPEKGDHETETFPLLAVRGLLWGFKSTAYWKSVETSKDLRELHEDLSTGALSTPAH